MLLGWFLSAKWREVKGMAYDEDLAARVRAALGAREELTEKKMFGGLGFMLNGNMCVGVTNDDLMVRVGADGH